MKGSLLSVAALAFAVPVQESGPGYVHVPLQRKDGRAPITLNGTKVTPSKRSDDIEALEFTGVRYHADYYIGTPPQRQSGLLDTGSSDVWTFGSVAWDGGFNGTNSSTYQWVNNDFSEKYGGGASVSGSWAQDTITFGNVPVPNFPFAYLNETDPEFPGPRGIFGIGRKAGEVSSVQHPTYIERLKDAGAISANAFSLYMTNANATEASLLIGGVDTAKYSGNLYTVPFSQGLVHSRFYSIEFEMGGQSFTGVVDSGSPEVLVSQNLADELAGQYNATFNSEINAYIRVTPPPMDLPDLPYKIGGIDLSIPGSEMFTQYGNIWVFAISRAVNENILSVNIVGDPIMRQLYLVYDIDANELGFAPVKITDESNIEPITSSIPGSTAAPDPGSYWHIL